VSRAPGLPFVAGLRPERGWQNAPMKFVDREDAGGRLADALGRAVDDVVVLGIPRGGVVVAAEIARRLDAPLDIVVPRKLRAPDNPELGIGAVAPGVRLLDERLVTRLAIGRDYLEGEIATQEEEIHRRVHAYRGDRAPARIEGRHAVVVDDGIATGGTAVAALRWTRRQRPDGLVLAVPVAPRQILPTMEREADEVVVLATPEPFLAVGEWYERFDQTTDDEVVSLLAERGDHAP
jgi:putative phosphoribosyl transferase